MIELIGGREKINAVFLQNFSDKTFFLIYSKESCCCSQIRQEGRRQEGRPQEGRQEGPRQEGRQEARQEGCPQEEVSASRMKLSPLNSLFDF